MQRLLIVGLLAVALIATAILLARRCELGSLGATIGGVIKIFGC